MPTPGRSSAPQMLGVRCDQGPEGKPKGACQPLPRRDDSGTAGGPRRAEEKRERKRRTGSLLARRRRPAAPGLRRLKSGRHCPFKTPLLKRTRRNNDSCLFGQAPDFKTPTVQAEPQHLSHPVRLLERNRAEGQHRRTTLAATLQAPRERTRPLRVVQAAGVSPRKDALVAEKTRLCAFQMPVLYPPPRPSSSGPSDRAHAACHSSTHAATTTQRQMLQRLLEK